MAQPSYLIAAENHNLLNSTEESWSDTILNLPKTAALGIGAGVVEILNVPITIGNWLSSEKTPQINYGAVLQEYDSDLGKYYKEHKLGIDTIGFIAGSIVPGMAGVKALRAGQTMLRASGEGAFGHTIGRSLGLLPPESTAALADAMSTIRSTGSVFSIGEANTVRALAGGFWQSTLESAAFETTVAATMYKSPVLDQASVSDLTWNIAIGTGLGGAIGGVLSGVGTVYKISGAGTAAQKELQYLTLGDVPAPNASASTKFLFYNNRVDDLLKSDLPLGDLAERGSVLRDASVKKLQLDMHTELQTLSGKDKEVAMALMQMSRGNQIETNLTNMLDSIAAGRVGITTDVEANLRKLDKKRRDPTKTLTPEEEQMFNDNQVTYIKVHGEGAGGKLTDPPPVLSVTDKMRSGETIELTKSGVKIGKQHITMDNNPHLPFNILGVSHQKVEARYWWAEKLPRWEDDHLFPYQVHANDLPLIEKAYKDGLSRLSVIPESGAIKDAVTIEGREQLYDFVISQKKYVIERLQTDPKGTISVGDFTDKFKSLFGINFNLTEELSPASPYYGFFQRLKVMGGKSGNLGAEGDVIALDKLNNITRPFAQVMHTLIHEKGHMIHRAILDAGGTAAANLKSAESPLVQEMMKIGMKQRAWYYGNDRALRQYGHDTVVSELIADTFAVISRNPAMLDKPANANIKQAFGHLIQPIPQDVLDAVAQRAGKTLPEEIAKIANVELQWMDGSAIRPGGEFARDIARSDYKKRMLDNGVRESEIVEDPLLLPSYVKMVTKLNHLKDDNGNVLEGMAKVMQQTKLYDEASARRAAQITGMSLPNMPDKDILTAMSTPTGVTSANAAYGSAGSVAQRVGYITHTLIKNAKTFSSELFTPTLSKIANNLDDAIGWSVLNEKLRNLPQRYYLSADRTHLTYGIAPVESAFAGDAKAFQKAIESYSDRMAEASNAGFPAIIPLKSENLQRLVSDHIQRNATRVVNRGIIRAGEGLPDNLDPMAFYPIPRNPKDTPHFAFVVDDTITGNGHSKMIYAADANALQLMKNDIMKKMPDVTILTKAESEAYFKAHGEFEFERTLNENHINTRMARAGVSASYLPMTNPDKIVNHFLEWHLARDAAGVREVISHRYSRQFEALRQGAAESLQAATSKIGYSGALTNLESVVDNPAIGFIKMALDVQKTADYPIWSSMNNLVDKVFSKAWAKAGAVFTDATTPERLEAITVSLKKSGYGGLTEITEPMYQAMNGTVPRGALTSFINKSNGLLATLALRLDPLNAMNNTIGAQVLLGTEVKSVFNAIRNGNAEAVGALAGLTNTKIPGIESSIQSPTKAVMAGMKAALDPANRKWARDNGFSTSITDQFDQTKDALAISAGDNVASLNKKIGNALAIAKKIGDTGEALTANKIAEEFNRTTAAFTMKQYTDIAVAHGLMTEATALTYINTFVNRTQGNFLASQRPLMFQGPIGQAMGLFQTYQFNMLQQLTRHIGEGQSKNAMLMMGLQGTIYGANGLPGFAALNTHIIGSAPGNTNHTDLYYAAYNAAGKEAGDWMMYGLGSNWMSIFSPDLKTNLYTRGDINPRNISVVPASPLDYPIVQAAAKLLGNIKESSAKIAMGGDVWSTFLRGVEQNGVSRPLAGMAQVIGGITSDTGQVTSINTKGNILMSHDILNLASLTRIAGGKPLDEALVNDAQFRFSAYSANDSAKKATLGEAIKLSILGGAKPDTMQMDEFISSYAKAGGKQKDFSQYYMKQYKNATASQANQMRDKLSSPYQQSLQEMMGGARLQDISISANSELGENK